MITSIISLYCSFVIAIVFLQPKLHKLLFIPNRILNYIWDLITVSVAAQIGTFLWSLLYFQQFSTYFLLTNLIVIPMATIILYTATIFFILGAFPTVASCIASLLNYETTLLNKFVQWVEQLPYSTIKCFIEPYQAILLAIILLGILFAITLKNNKRFIAICVSFVSLLALLAIFSIRVYNVSNQEKLVIYSAANNPIIQLLEGQQSIVYSADSINAQYFIENFTRKHHVQIQHCLIEENDLKGFVFKGQRYIILQGEILHNKHTSNTLKTDHLIVAGIKNTYIEEILKRIDTDHVIITPALGYNKRKRLKEYCQKQDIKYTDIQLTGAYINP